MATRLADRVPLERIEQRARPVNLGQLLVTLVVGVFYALGFAAAKVVVIAGVLLGWVVAAVVTGWQDAGKPVEERRRASVA
jgi:predicted PurR-regulated permease PerM